MLRVQFFGAANALGVFRMVRVSVNDMKLSDQDLSCPALDFLRYANCFLRPDSERKKPMSYFQQIKSARKQIVSPYHCAFVAFVSCVLFTACGLLCAQTGG